jgi:hypothetical protein
MNSYMVMLLVEGFVKLEGIQLTTKQKQHLLQLVEEACSAAANKDYERINYDWNS